MKIKEIIKMENESGCRVCVRRDENGTPTSLEVYYCGSGNNQMALPYDIGTYFQTPRGWEFEQAER